jgi:predicted DNA-binding transcriptional regulator AlpA
MQQHRNRFIRMAELATTKKRTGLLPVCPATVWNWVQRGIFPAPIKLSTGTTCWDITAVEAFIASRAQGGAV